MKKKVFVALLSVFTVAAASTAGIVSYDISAKNNARVLLVTEISDIEESAETVAADSKKIKERISEVDAELNERDTVNNSYMEYKETNDSLSEEITELQSRIDRLDADIEAKKSELKESGAISKVEKGRKYALSGNESYSCPDKLSAGRYIAEGSGQLTVLNSSGRARISQNLTVSYDHTYTFDLSKGEKVQVSEDITLTELK